MFYVLNSDIICEFPLKEMLEFHKKHGKEGTILLTKVDDPSKYGVIVADGNGKIKRFVEKPKEFISDRINAGIYLLSTKVIDRIEVRSIIALIQALLFLTKMGRGERVIMRKQNKTKFTNTNECGQSRFGNPPC